MKIFALTFLILLFSLVIFSQTKKDAPNFDVTSVDGKQLKLQDLKGKVVVINFWGIWCPPCLQEIPRLNQLVVQYKTKDVVFIAFTEDDEAKLKKFLKTKPFKYNIIPKSTEVIETYMNETDIGGVMRYPTHIVINQDGKIEVIAEEIRGLTKVRKKLTELFSTKK